MPVVLMILSVLAAWALLGVLATGLLLIVKALQSIRGWFEKVVVGVRAVEQQLAPLDAYARALSASTTDTAAALDAAARRLAETDTALRVAAGSDRVV
ncbi:MAG: hypothetical protein KY462_06000 [Actinobacteria bacterium]|nr:hypothetical protein [Actinomycetota bacterium]